MDKDSTFHDYVVHDLLGKFPRISSRAMFGGYGIYKEGKIFAILVDDELYLKGREETKDFFESRNSRQFTYSRKGGKIYAMNYWFVPEEVYENRDAFVEWVDTALYLLY